MQRELRRQVRLSQSLKQQVKQLEETMRGLERRVEAQRRELKLNEQTMELMDQSRKLAEDQAYAAQKKARLAESDLLKSPLRQGGARASPHRSRSRTNRDSRGDYTRVAKVSAPRLTSDQKTSERGFPRLAGNSERRSQIGSYDQNGRRIRRLQDNSPNAQPRRTGTFQFNKSQNSKALNGWGEDSSPIRGPRQPSGQQRTPGSYRQK